MKISEKNWAKTAGMPPGTLVHVGKQKTEKVHISLIYYDEANLVEQEYDQIEPCFPYLQQKGVTWISVRGLHQIEVIGKLGNYLGLHLLLQEDVLNTTQRPKINTHENCALIVLKSLSLYPNDELMEEQVSIILGKNFVVTFEEGPKDLFKPIRERIRSSKEKVKKFSADYLAYSIVDFIVDQYFVVLEIIGEQLQDLEDSLVDTQEKGTIRGIHHLKKQMRLLRRSIWPLRGIIDYMGKGETDLISSNTVIYLRDVYDHIVEAVEIIEIYRDTLSGMLDIYLSNASNKMNEIMKMLTIIATIFIPLTFIAGVYGMNFRHMPELEWRWGYPAVLGFMIMVSAVMLLYFRKKKWF